jgi:hypothetical protein
MRLRFALSALPFAAACHGAPAAATDASAMASPPDPVAPRPQVQLTWRLFETRRWLDGDGQEHQSSIFELLIEGGQPSRVELGRRESVGCVVKDATDAPSYLAGLECHAGVHGEYANVSRPSPGELRIEAFGQDEGSADHEPPRTPSRPSRTSPTAASVRIPIGSDVVVDRELARIPGDAPPRQRLPWPHAAPLPSTTESAHF